MVILVNILLYPLYLISNFVKKDNKLWVFGAWQGEKYSDNSKYFYEYCISNAKERKVVWITKNKKVIDSIRSDGGECYHCFSLKGIYYQVKASKVFITHSVFRDLLACSISSQTEIYQLWHGLPLKKVMYDAISDSALKKVIALLFPYISHRADKIVSVDSELGNILVNSFRLPPQSTCLTGLPRSDAFRDKAEKGTNSLFKCIYMPTLRGPVNSEFKLLSSFDFLAFNEILKKESIQFVIRLHPMNSFSSNDLNMINECSHVQISTEDDIYENITSYDCLVTDFSSIYFDYLLTGNPIIFAPFNMNNFTKNDRSLYFEYKDLTIGPYVQCCSELINEIIKVKNGHFPSGYEIDYLNLYKKVWGSTSISDVSSCEKLYLEIIKGNQ